MLSVPIPQEEEDTQEPKLWRSCCIQLDKQAVMYFSQIGIGVMVLSFSAVQLVRADFQCDQSSGYMALVSFIIGTYVPRLSK